jgi:hypothetical protein
MFKWLRSWFAWRFSLTRLVVAVVFLGVLVGLNLCGPCVAFLPQKGKDDRIISRIEGWPLPAIHMYYRGQYIDAETESIPTETEEDNEFGWLPWTHQTYRLLEFDPLKGLFDWTRLFSSDDSYELTIYLAGTIIDALFALTVLSLILFLHPRRNPPAEAPT